MLQSQDSHPDNHSEDIYMTHHTLTKPSRRTLFVMMMSCGMASPALITSASAQVGVFQSQVNASALQLGKARFRSVDRRYDYNYNYERYRRDCAEYMSKYGTGKSCQFPARVPTRQVVVVQNNYYANPHVGQYGSQEPVLVVNVNREQPSQSSVNGFRIINTTQQNLPVGWSRNLKRGDILEQGLYNRGRVTYRSPRGEVRIRIGDTTIQLQENNRKIISVINP